jgi:hypothetical protein
MSFDEKSKNVSLKENREWRMEGCFEDGADACMIRELSWHQQRRANTD